MHIFVMIYSHFFCMHKRSVEVLMLVYLSYLNEGAVARSKHVQLTNGPVTQV